MSNFYTLHCDNSAIGGYEHRLTTDGTTVNVQCRSPHADTFRTFYSLPYSEVQAKFGWLLRDPYKNSVAAYDVYRACDNPYR